MHGSREDINRFYLPYINFFLESLESCDWDGAAESLESLLFYELQFAATRLDELGVKNITSLLFTEREPSSFTPSNH